MPRTAHTTALRKVTTVAMMPKILALVATQRLLVERPCVKHTDYTQIHLLWRIVPTGEDHLASLPLGDPPDTSLGLHDTREAFKSGDRDSQWDLHHYNLPVAKKGKGSDGKRDILNGECF